MSSATDTKNKNDGIFSMVRLGLILAAYAVASCTVLALVNNFTSPVIEQNNIKKANEAMRAVFAEADDFEKVKDDSLPIDSLYFAKKGGNVIGAVAQVSGPTYDRATIMFGVNKDGLVTGLRFLENTDSPGFGLKASDPTFKLASGKTFYEQFAGKKVAEGFTAGKTFDAITGATITSNGVAGLIETGCSVIDKYLKEAGK